MRFRLFIFDFDGTLADSGPWLVEAFKRTAARFRLRQPNSAEIEALRGRDSRAALRDLGIPLWRLPQIAAYVRRLAREAPSPPLFGGIAAMLRDLRAADCKLAIVSSNNEQTIRRALGAECAELIHVYACDASMFGKAPKLRHVLRQTRMTADQAISIGDETRDIEAARAARLACGAVAWGYATPALLRAHAPDFLFHAPHEIVSLACASAPVCN
jgi:phosphoglycolate phosphatase